MVVRKRKNQANKSKEIQDARDDCCSKGKTPDGTGKYI
jgi:hypothetical protein